MNKLLTPILIVFTLLWASEAVAQDTPQPGTRQVQPGGLPAQPTGNSSDYRQQVSYALGRNFGQNLRELPFEFDIQSIVAGISDVLSGSQPKWTDDQLQAPLQRFGMEMQQQAMARNQQEAAKNSKDAEAFLAQNAKREGVQTTPSGLQYRVLRQGNGASPTLTDVVRCNYRGTLLNGTEFDNSANHGGPVEFPVNRVIPGWTEALQKMKTGDKWQLFIPPNLAYGENPPGPPIEVNSLLVFDIELVDVVQQ